MTENQEYENEEGGIPDPDSYEGAPDTTGLEAQIKAQEAGDPVAAKAAAKREGYPPHVIEPVDVSDEEVERAHQDEAREAAEEDPPAPQAEAEIRPAPMLREGFDIKVFRLANGEWIVGQFRVYEEEQGEGVLAFYKVFRYQIGQNPQNGQMMINMSAWPVEEGSLEFFEVTANGNPNAGTHGVNIGDAYLQFISPIAQANQQQAAAVTKQESKKRARAQRILNAGGRF